MKRFNPLAIEATSASRYSKTTIRLNNLEGWHVNNNGKFTSLFTSIPQSNYKQTTPLASTLDNALLMLAALKDSCDIILY